MKTTLIAMLLVVGCGGDANDGADAGIVVDPNCTGLTCASAGASCGMIPDGCGRMLDCGECAGGDHDGCIVTTCEDADAQCGDIDNGCGVPLPCGMCDDDESCVANHCVELDCGSTGFNACGGCSDLPTPPGAQCACGGTTACTEYGSVTCGEDPYTVLAATDDSEDDWTSVTGEVNLINDGFVSGATGLPVSQTASYSIYVDDTFYGNMEPEFRLDNPSGLAATICVDNSLYDSLLQCADEGYTVGHKCCKDVPAGATTFTFAAAVSFGWPNVFDDSLHLGMRVHFYAPTVTAPICPSFTLSYRF